MPSLTYIIPNARENGSPVNREKRIYLYLYASRHNRTRFKTDFVISPTNWNFDKQQATKGHKAHQKLNSALLELKATVEAKYIDMQRGKHSFDSICSMLSPIIAGSSAGGSEFWNVWGKYMISEEKRVTFRTIQKYNSLATLLKEFEKSTGSVLTFEAIDLNFYDKFKSYLDNDKEYLTDTAAKYGNSLKHFLGWGYDRNYHSNRSYKRFRFPRVPKHENIFLSMDELSTLYKYPFLGKLAEARDIFCFLCFTGVRISDALRFDPKDVKDDIWRFLDYKNRRRGKTVEVPLNHGFISPSLTILERNGGTLPKMTHQKINDLIKVCCREIGMREPVDIHRSQGNKDVTKTFEKWETITTHTGRRTFITLLANQGTPIHFIARITGQNEATVMKYINTTQASVLVALDRTKAIAL